MGFAPVAAVAVLMLASLASFATYQVQQDVTRDQVVAAQRAQEDRQAERLATTIDMSSAIYSLPSQRLTLTVSNSGSAVVDVDGMEVLVDGVVRTSDVLSWQVGGQDVRYWAPEQSLVIVVQGVTSTPSRAAVIAHNGAATYGSV